MKNGKQLTVRFKDACDSGPAMVEIEVPSGLSRAELGSIVGSVIDTQLGRFGPRGCLTCLSGLDFRIRERFENVITFNT